jgi:hypothetical protein
MSRLDQHLPPDDWLALSDTERAEALRRVADNGHEAAEPTSPQVTGDGTAAEEKSQSADELTESPPITIVPATLERVYRLAASLDCDDRLRLAALIWRSLPASDRASLVSMQFECAQKPIIVSEFIDEPVPLPELHWPKLAQFLFDPTATSELYSAPRRFDLATIFVVTAAYSLLFGFMTALDASPGMKIVLGGVVTIVAAAQALFLKVANPRGVSIVTGAAAYTLFSWIAWFIDPHTFFFSSLFYVTFINGLIGGSMMGYLAGVLVGGVFLVADALRTRYGRPEEPHALPDEPLDASSIPGDTNE